MPNRKQKQLLREEKRRRATAEKSALNLAADQFEEQRMMQLAHEADQRGDALVFPRLPVKTRKRLKWKQWKRGASTNHLKRFKRICLLQRFEHFHARTMEQRPMIYFVKLVYTE